VTNSRSRVGFPPTIAMHLTPRPGRQRGNEPCYKARNFSARRSDRGRPVRAFFCEVPGMYWTTIWIATLGLLTTMSAPLVQYWMTARRERAVWTRARQAEAYADALLYAQALEKMLEPLTATDVGWQPGQYSLPLELITAHMRMFAADTVLDSWKALLRHEEVFRWNTSQDFPALGVEPGEAVARDHPDVMRLRAQIQDFYAVIRRVIGT
jgi:hypothetical protein